MAAACFFGLFGLLALLIPIDAGMAIVLYIGIAMTAQAFQATPPPWCSDCFLAWRAGAPNC